MTQSYTYAKKAITGRGQRHEQGKALLPSTINNSQSLNHSSTSRDTAPQHSFKRKGKGHPQKTRAPDSVRRPLCGVEPG